MGLHGSILGLQGGIWGHHGEVLQQTGFSGHVWSSVGTHGVSWVSVGLAWEYSGMPRGPLGLVWGRLIGCMGRQMEVGDLAATSGDAALGWHTAAFMQCHPRCWGGGILGADPHCLHPTGRLWVRAAHLPPVRQVLPGGPAAFLYGGFRHRCRHLPEGGGNLPTSLPLYGIPMGPCPSLPSVL